MMQVCVVYVSRIESFEYLFFENNKELLIPFGLLAFYFLKNVYKVLI
jgi:hypothetical protein